MHVISVKIGDHCCHGLCDMGASASAIPHSLYKEIMHDIAPAEIEEIDVTIKLTNRDTISPVGIVRDVAVLCGKVNYPADFLVLGSPQDNCYLLSTALDFPEEERMMQQSSVSISLSFENQGINPVGGCARVP